MKIRSLLIITCACCLAGPLSAFSSAPQWSVSPRDPVTVPADLRPLPPAPEDHGPTASLGRDYTFLLLHFYQRILSVVMISRCRMLPTCSNYSVQAIRKHGPFVGIMMTADRLLHEAHAQKEAPIVFINGRAHFPDPVENNDFWWYRRP